MEERLKKYNAIIAEIDDLNKQIIHKKKKIKALEYEEAQPSSPVLEVTGIKAKGYMRSAVENKGVNNLDKIERLKRDIERLELDIEELEKELECIDSRLNILNSKDRRIMELKYKAGLEMKTIMADTGYSKGGIEYIIRTSLKKMENSKLSNY